MLKFNNFPNNIQASQQILETPIFPSYCWVTSVNQYITCIQQIYGNVPPNHSFLAVTIRSTIQFMCIIQFDHIIYLKTVNM